MKIILSLNDLHAASHKLLDLDQLMATRDATVHLPVRFAGPPAEGEKRQETVPISFTAVTMPDGTTAVVLKPNQPFAIVIGQIAPPEDSPRSRLGNPQGPGDDQTPNPRQN